MGPIDYAKCDISIVHINFASECCFGGRGQRLLNHTRFINIYQNEVAAESFFVFCFFFGIARVTRYVGQEGQRKAAHGHLPE